jgi:hypothetical protein
MFAKRAADWSVLCLTRALAFTPDDLALFATVMSAIRFKGGPLSGRLCATLFVRSEINFRWSSKGTQKKS